MAGPRVFFHQLSAPMRGDQIAAKCYRDPDRDLVKSFNALNGLSGNEMFYPGRLILTPERGAVSHSNMGMLPSMASEAAWRANHATMGPAPTFFNSNFNGLAAARDGVGAMSTLADAFFEGGQHYLKENLKLLARDARAINRSYVVDATRKLPPPRGRGLARFSPGAAERRALMGRMQGTLDGLPEQMSRVLPTPSALADSGVSHSVVKRSVRLSGDSVQLKKVGTAISEIDDLSRKVSKTGDMVGVSLTALQGGIEIWGLKRGIASVERDSPDRADVYGAYRGARAIGATAGGYAGGELGVALGGVAAAVFFASNPIGWGAAACIGVGALVGAVAGGAVGEHVAGDMMESHLMSIDSSRADDIAWVKKRLDAD